MTDHAGDWRERLASVDWSAYESAYGSAAGVADQILSLRSLDREGRLQASHELWASLCHQHAFVSSAALPALPFLLEALEDANEELAVELLDILVGFAVCTSPRRAERPQWAEELAAGLEDAKPLAQRLA